MSTAFWFSYALLWALVAALVIAVFALYQHFGQIYASSPEGRATQGPEEGARLAPLEVDDVNGKALMLPLMDRATLVVFASTTCTICAELRNSLRRLAVEGPNIAIVVLCEGHPRTVRAWAGGLAAQVPVIPDPRGRLAARYGISVTPYLVVVGQDGVVRGRGIVNDYEGLELAARDATRSLPIA
jgi:hypothetical protein